MVPQILHPSSNESQLYQSAQILNNLDITEIGRIQEPSVESCKIIDQSQTTRSIVVNPSQTKQMYQRLNSCKDSTEFPEMDFPVK